MISIVIEDGKVGGRHREKVSRGFGVLEVGKGRILCLVT